jgi:hypothetical protein
MKTKFAITRHVVVVEAIVSMLWIIINVDTGTACLTINLITNIAIASNTQNTIIAMITQVFGFGSLFCLYLK